MKKDMVEAANALFRESCEGVPVEADEQYDSAELWQALEEQRLTLISVPETLGGSGGSFVEAAAVLRLVGSYAAPVPLAETGLLAGWALSTSGMSVPEARLTVAPVHLDQRIVFRQESNGWTLSGHAGRVPAAGTAARLVVIGHNSNDKTTMIASVDPADCEISSGENLAGEPRDNVIFDDIRVSENDVLPAGAGVDEENLQLRGALARSVLIAGACERALELSLSYAKDRHQFGRPIGKFQAIQQQLAVLAGEVTAASAAADAAVEAVSTSSTAADAAFEIAAAKIRTGEAAGRVAAIAHQVHGAMGFTERHPLRYSTRRLWAWRDEFGTESEWSTRLGGMIVRRGPETLWPAITTSLSASERESLLGRTYGA